MASWDQALTLLQDIVIQVWHQGKPCNRASLRPGQDREDVLLGSATIKLAKIAALSVSCLSPLATLNDVLAG